MEEKKIVRMLKEIEFATTSVITNFCVSYSFQSRFFGSLTSLHVISLLENIAPPITLSQFPITIDNFIIMVKFPQFFISS